MKVPQGGVSDKLFVFKHFHLRFWSAIHGNQCVFTLLHFMKGIQFFFNVSQTLILDTIHSDTLAFEFLEII